MWPSVEKKMFGSTVDGRSVIVVWRKVGWVHNLRIGAVRSWQLRVCVCLKPLLAIGRFTIARAGLRASEASVE